MNFYDQVTFDGVTRTGDGYLVAVARVARTGVQEYSGAELGKPELDKVRLYRPEEEVFHKDAMHSFAHRPVTVDHPDVMLSASNWKKYAVGQTGEEVARDGEFVRVPLVLMDAAAISAVVDGKRQLSMGYVCDIKWEPGVTPTGEQYDAVQTSIRGNHLAVVSAARGGPSLKIGDKEKIMTMRTVVIDGLSIETTEQGAQAIDKLLRDAKAAADTAAAKQAADAAKITELSTSVQTKDGEIAALKQQLKDAEVTPVKLDAAVTARAKIVADAKRISPNVVVDGKTNIEIQRAAVTAKLGEPTAKGMTDAGIEGAFAALSPPGSTSDPVLTASLGDVQRPDDLEAIQAKRKQGLQSAYRQEKAA